MFSVDKGCFSWVGKTTIITKMAAEPAEGFDVFFLEVEGIDSCDHLTELLLNRFRRLFTTAGLAKSRFDGFWEAVGGIEIGGVIKLPEKKKLNWQDTLEKVIDGICKNRPDTQAELTDYSMLIQMPNATADEKAKALFNRGNIYSQLGDTQAALANYTTLIKMSDAPANQKAKALVSRGIAYSQQRNTHAALADYTTLLQMPDAPADLTAMALLGRGVIHRESKDWLASANDFEAALAKAGISSEIRTSVLFALPELMVAIEPLKRVVAALTIAFERGDKASEAYGGTPGDLISMIVQRGPSEWASYATAIAPLYIQYGVAEKLGRGITQSIQFLDEGDFSASQLDLWYQAWQGVGQDSDELQIPLQCLRAAVEVLKSDPPSDRPLFGLPLEIRQLVRPLLQNKLNGV